MAEQNTQTQNTQTQTQPTEPNANTPAFDYDKLANLIAGKQTVTEDTVLKSYFKQQGLSADEMTQAINAFKETKAKNTPNVSELQNNLTAEKSARLQAEINSSATLEAIKQGVDVKSIPYVLKMADFKNCTDEKGNIDTDKMKTAIKTVLDDIPALKGSNVSDNNSGFQKIGGDGDKNNETTEEALRGIFGIKK